MTGDDQSEPGHLARMRSWIKAHVPPGLRLVLGLLLILGGVFGFLPVLGFWMIPLGIVVAGLDMIPLWRYVTRRGSTSE